jgi:signal transduction histidine kinase
MHIRLGFKEKLLLVIFLISIFSFSILAINRMSILQRALRTRTLYRMESVGNILAAELISDLKSNDQPGIRRLLATTTRQPLIDFALVVDPENRVLFSSESGLAAKIDPFKDTPDIKYFGSARYVRSFPLKESGRNIGRLQIGFSLAQFKGDIRRTLFWSGGLSVLSMLLILGFAWMISGFLLRPLVGVNDALGSIARGDFGKRVPVRSEDIIGEISASVNIAAAQLEDLTRGMQKKIDQATSQLTEANGLLLLQKEKLEEANRRLVELDQLKSDFISIAAHELKTPLTSMVGFAKTLQKLDLPAEDREKYLEIINSEGQRMECLIDEFLDISKIEGGNLILQLTDTNIMDIVERAIDALVVEPDKKVEVKIPAIAAFLADPERLLQVILNLLSNAIRYTKSPGKVIIKAEETKGELIVSVSDEGTGIPKECLGQIFDKFYRCSDEITQRSRGSGLGLFIAKGIIEMHGGRIWADSEPGKGSRLTFMIPLKRR